MFSFNLKQIRKAKVPKITQQQLADALGVTQQSIVRWENGSGSPNPDMLMKVASVLEVSVDELCGREERFIQEEERPDLDYFTSAQDAVKFILEQKQVEAFGGYDLDVMSEEEIVRFANDILVAVQLIGQKYKR